MNERLPDVTQNGTMLVFAKVNDYCFTPNEQMSIYIMGEQATLNEMSIYIMGEQVTLNEMSIYIMGEQVTLNEMSI
jgi:hypothetical protein